MILLECGIFYLCLAILDEDSPSMSRVNISDNTRCQVCPIDIRILRILIDVDSRPGLPRDILEIREIHLDMRILSIQANSEEFWPRYVFYPRLIY
jgi:hypothetical protein